MRSRLLWITFRLFLSSLALVVRAGVRTFVTTRWPFEHCTTFPQEKVMHKKSDTLYAMSVAGDLKIPNTIKITALEMRNLHRSRRVDAW